MRTTATTAAPGDRDGSVLPSGRGLLAQTSVYGVFTMLRRAVALVLTPVYTHYLHPHDFGMLEILSLGAWLTTIIGVCKVDAAFYRYYVAAGTPARRRGILSAAYFLTLTISSVLLGVAAIAFPLLPRLLPQASGIPADAFYVVLAAAWLDLSTLVPLAFCRATERVKFVGVVSVTQAIVSGTVAALGVIVFDWGYRAVLWGTLLGTALTAVGCAWVVARERLRLDFDVVPALLKYGIPMMPGTLFMYVMSSTDRYFLASAHGLADVGVYAVAAKFALVLQMVVMTPFGEMWAANQFKLHAAGLKGLYERTSLLYLATLFIAALGLGLFAYDVVTLAFGREYQGVIRLVPLLAFGVALWGIVPTVDLGSLVAPNKTWIRSLATGLAAGVNIACNVVLVPRFGTYGAALAAIVGFATLAAATCALNYPLVDMRAPIGRVLLMVVGLAIAMCAVYAGDAMSAPEFFSLRLACFAGYAGLLYLVAWRSTSGAEVARRSALAADRAAAS